MRRLRRRTREGGRYGWIGGRREKVRGGVKGLSSHAEVRDKVRGGCGFSSLMKQQKKAKICFFIYIAGFFFLNFFCYEVIVKQIFKERPTNHYSPSLLSRYPLRCRGY
jgi:hypothetical protein